jgi:hypothetical protein
MMIQKHRIYTNIGRDQKINVEIKQEWNLIEILSLKFSQKDIYASGACSEYGVVVGRISANNGFGIPNAKVSIFIPQSDLDVNDPVISKLYPYTTVYDKDENGYRYNLLPARQQHSGHSPTGTFFDQEDILTREECLEVFESYYIYTVKTNGAGDFMIWGVPIGSQVLHVDIDLSDIGCFSLRPYDFIRKGVGIDEFERYYKFKSSSDIDGLPQIVSYDQTINVYPFWGNEELCEIGITRTDFDLSSKGITISPMSLILASAVTDDNSDAVKRSGRIKKNAGYKCNLQTTSGKVECIRYTGRKVYASDGVTLYPELETLNITEVIDENGILMAVLPMNLEYVYTNELGEQEITNDRNKGIATTAIARFRFGLDISSGKITAAKYLVPNIREYNPNSDGTSHGYGDNIEYDEGMLATYQFSEIFEDYITVTPPTGVTIYSTNYNTSAKSNKKNLMLGVNNNNIPEDYFYKFIYGKVYAVSSFQGSHFDGNKRDSFLGIKQIRPTADEDCASRSNYFPTNFGYKNRSKFSLILSQVLLFLQYIVTVIFVKIGELLGKFFYTISRFFYGLGIGKWRPFRKFSQQLEDLAYRIQDRFTQQLPLTTYPDCEECSSTDTSVLSDTSYSDSYCRLAEIKLKVPTPLTTPILGDPIILFTTNSPSNDNFRNAITDSTFLTGTTETSSFFDNTETARDSDGPCTIAPALNFTDLVNLSSATQIDIEGLGTVPRYVAEVYGWSDVLGNAIISEYVSNIISPYQSSEDFSFVVDGGNLTVQYSSDAFAELTGIEIGSTPAPIFTNTYVVIRIYDRTLTKDVILTGSTNSQIEEGCNKYDKVYNEGIRMSYVWSSGTTYGSTYSPLNPNSGVYIEDPTYMESILPDTIHTNLLSTVIAKSGAMRMPRYKPFTRIGRGIYDRKTKSGYTEFRDGEFTIIPIIRGKSNNSQAIQEWYRRKRIGLSFCGGVVNYSFIDNWLNGLLYFFKFDNRIRWDNEDRYDLNQRGTKYPRELIFYNIFDKNYYYRSTPYNLLNGFIGQFNLTSATWEILHPTSFYDVGVRDEFLHEICYDPAVDPSCSVIRDIGATSYQDAANIVEYAINYRLDISNSNFDIDDFFNGPAYSHKIKVFDGDITQLISINCEAGVEAFDLDSSQYYMYNGELMDPESSNFGYYFKNVDGLYGPTPIDMKLDINGEHVRLCLNNRLGDYSQKVPFYLWDKKDAGFGSYGDTSDDQSWDKTAIASMPLQRMFSVSGVTETTIYDSLFLRTGRTNYLMPDGEEEYLLMPMTIDHNTFSITGQTVDTLERFEVISYYYPDTSPNGALQYIEGDLWLYVTLGTIKDPQKGYIYVVVNKEWTLQSDQYIKGDRETFIFQTVQNYYGKRQVLSSPFLFYFGLRPEKTALDLLIKYFGPKGAFVSSVPGCPIPEITPTPSSIPPTPTDVTVTPTVTPTPTPPEDYFYRLVKCVEGMGTYYYAKALSGYFSSGNLVWGSVECDPNYAYTVAGSTTTESDYISAGYTNIGTVSLDTYGHGSCVDCLGNPITPPPTPTPGPQTYGVHATGSYGSSALACAGGTPTGTYYMPYGHYPPVVGDYMYTDSGCTVFFTGDGNWYHVYTNSTWYALQIIGGYVSNVVTC